MTHSSITIALCHDIRLIYSLRVYYVDYSGNVESNVFVYRRKLILYDRIIPELDG